MMPARSNLTDRAKRYRAQSAVRGAQRCVLCGVGGRLDVMHLDGNEGNGDQRNLAYGCRSCNGKLAAAFKRIGAGVPTNQYNPQGGVPTFEQYAWAVTQGSGGSHHGRYVGSQGGKPLFEPGAHDEAGVIIHATPKSKRIEYAARLASLRGSHRSNGGGMSKRNIWPFGAGQPLGTRTTHRRRTSRPAVSAKAAQKQAREREAERLESKLSARDLNAQLQRHYSRGGTLSEFLQANPGLKPIAKLHREYEKLAQQIGPERNARKVQALLQKRDMVARELARLGFPVNPGTAHNSKAWTEGFAAGKSAQLPSQCPYGTGCTEWRSWHYGWLEGDGKRWEERYAQEQDDRRSGRRKNSLTKVQERILELIGRERTATENAELVRLYAAEEKRRRTKKRNPAEAAAEMYDKFHGRPSGEVLEFTKDVHYHSQLAALGDLERLTVRANDGGLVDLEGFGDAVLCSNEKGTQLYIEGGDQAVKLSAFGIGKPYHDIEDLGEVVKLWYFTTKDHLGDQGGEASYHHTLSEEKRLRMQQDFGKKRAPKPRLLYDTLNQSLAFAGGEYTVEPEGIRN